MAKDRDDYLLSLGQNAFVPSESSGAVNITKNTVYQQPFGESEEVDLPYIDGKHPIDTVGVELELSESEIVEPFKDLEVTESFGVTLSLTSEIVEPKHIESTESLGVTIGIVELELIGD